MNLGDFNIAFCGGNCALPDYGAWNPGDCAISFCGGPALPYQTPSGIVLVEDTVSNVAIASPAATIAYDHWVLSWSKTPDGWDSNTWQLRQVLESGKCAESGGMVRVKIAAPDSGNLTITGMSIGERSGSTVDMAGTPTRLTFDSGNNGCTVAAGSGGKWSDGVIFTLDKTKEYIVQINTGGGRTAYKGGEDGTNRSYYNFTLSPDYIMTAAVSSFSAQNYYRMIDEVDVWSGAYIAAAVCSNIVIGQPAWTLDLPLPASAGLFFANG